MKRFLWKLSIGLACVFCPSGLYAQCSTGSCGVPQQSSMMFAPATAQMNFMRGTQQSFARVPVRRVPPVANLNRPPAGAQIVQIGPKQKQQQSNSSRDEKLQVAVSEKTVEEKSKETNTYIVSLIEALTESVNNVAKQSEALRNDIDGVIVQLDAVAGDFRNLSNSVNSLSRSQTSLSDRLSKVEKKEVDFSNMRFVLREVK